MSKVHVFFGKFLIKEKDGTDEYEVSAAQMSAKERDTFAGIVRCRDCKHYHASIHGCDEFGDEWRNEYANVEPDGFCSWGEREEVDA